jgi:hypothetical protein
LQLRSSVSRNLKTDAQQLMRAQPQLKVQALDLLICMEGSFNSNLSMTAKGLGRLANPIRPRGPASSAKTMSISDGEGFTMLVEVQPYARWVCRGSAVFLAGLPELRQSGPVVASTSRTLASFTSRSPGS